MIIRCPANLPYSCFFGKTLPRTATSFILEDYIHSCRQTRNFLLQETSGGIMSKKSFEEALESLEQITRELENGDLSLEKSLKKFDEGIKLAELCNHKLEEAQQKVDL
ncbi:MAG: exodeoxyribonuclease VII small subunit, partial [Desulfurivibrionaceae bacterium]